MIRPTLILRFLGVLFVMIGLAMCLPGVISAFSGEYSSFLFPVLFSCGVGAILYWSLPAVKGDISHREAFAIVTMGWVAAALICALPFWLFGMTPAGKKFFPDFSSSYFEAMSGLTTTGATILPSIQDLPASMLMWRSLTHWLGGMGIILLGVAILPFLGVGGMQLYKAEVPGPTADKLSPRIAETAKSLWFVYILLTAVETVMLMFGGMSLFDAVCHSFATIATGGFSTKNISVEAFNSVYIEMVITFFMFLAGMNFALHFFWLRGDLKTVWKNEEFRFYGAVFLIWSVAMAVTLQVSGYYKTIGQALRYTSFQTISILTSTGFSSCNFDLWRTHANHSFFAICWLALLMLIGGSAGSTGGGVKCVRVWILFKVAQRELFRLIHPRVVRPIKLNGRAVSEEVIASVTGFVALYMLCTGFCTLLMTFFNLDLLSAFTAVLASIGNIGPGLSKFGPYESYGFVPAVGKWILIFCMLLGRLELYTVLILLLPSFWRR